MYETQGQPPDTPNFVRHWGESAFRDGEDDGIGAFHWLDEGFGHAWRHADRALLFRAGGDRQPADRAGWRQSQASAGTREGQLTDHLVASLAAHENFTGLVAHQNRLILPASAPQQRYFIAHQNPLPQPFLE
jgi:hypothetical protein